MATIGTKLNLLDVAKAMGPDGKPGMIVEQLNKFNVITDRMPVIEGNLPVGHQTNVRSGLPIVTWRKLGYGVATSKSGYVKIQDSCGMLEGYSEIDKDTAMLNGNTKAFRMSEDTAFLESMAQSFEKAIFYGDSSADPEKIMGFAPRFNSLSAENAVNIINGGGSGSTNTSIWLVGWGDQTVHGIYPKGSQAGLIHSDLGEVTLIDSQGGLYQGLRSHYQWKIGLTVKDWRYVVRIANIDVTALKADASTGANLIQLMVKAANKLRGRKLGSPVFYVPTTVMDFLDLQVMNMKNLFLSYKDFDGNPVLNFRGIPIDKSDSILETESAVV